MIGKRFARLICKIPLIQNQVVNCEQLLLLGLQAYQALLLLELLHVLLGVYRAMLYGPFLGHARSERHLSIHGILHSELPLVNQFGCLGRFLALFTLPEAIIIFIGLDRPPIAKTISIAASSA